MKRFSSLSSLVLSALLATGAVSALAQTEPEAAYPGAGASGRAAGHGPMARGPHGGAGGPGGPAGMGPGHPGMHHHGRGVGGPLMMLMGPGLDRALEMVKATPEQRAEIRRIAGAARDDLRAARRPDAGRAQQQHQAFLSAWTAEQVDGAALEQQRAQRAAQREVAGKRMVQAAVDIGRVLKPEQRRVLAEHWRAHAGGAHRRAEAQMDLLGFWHADAAAD